MRLPTSFGPLAMAAILLASAAGCTPSLQGASADAARGATPALADSSLKLLEDPATRERLASVLATPEVQQAMQELSGGLALGALKGLSSEEATAHTNELVSRFVRTLTTALAQGLEDDLAPALRSMTNDTIDAALDGAASPAHRQKLDQLTGLLVSSVMRSAAREIPSSIGPAMHEAMLGELGPALREILRKDIAPGMADALASPAFKAALGETSREVAYRAVLGSNEALAELAERQDREGGSPLGAFFAGRTWLLVAIVAAVVLAVPLVWLLRDRRLARRYREDMERRNARAMALLGAMQSAPEGAWSTHVLALLREQLLDETTKPGREAERPSPPRSSRPHRPRHA